MAANPLLQVCCCGPSGHEILIDCCMLSNSSMQRTKAGSATLSAYVSNWTEIVMSDCIAAAGTSAVMWPVVTDVQNVFDFVVKFVFSTVPSDLLGEHLRSDLLLLFCLVGMWSLCHSKPNSGLFDFVVTTQLFWIYCGWCKLLIALWSSLFMALVWCSSAACSLCETHLASSFVTSLIDVWCRVQYVTAAQAVWCLLCCI